MTDEENNVTVADMYGVLVEIRDELQDGSSEQTTDGYDCERCGKVFESSGELGNHVQYEHSQQDRLNTKHSGFVDGMGDNIGRSVADELLNTMANLPASPVTMAMLQPFCEHSVNGNMNRLVEGGAVAKVGESRPYGYKLTSAGEEYVEEAN